MELRHLSTAYFSGGQCPLSIIVVVRYILFVHVAYATGLHSFLALFAESDACLIACRFMGLPHVALFVRRQFCLHDSLLKLAHLFVSIYASGPCGHMTSSC